jgi:zinc transporter
MSIHKTSYGSDETGLIWGYHFQPGKPAQVITATQAFEYLRGDGGLPPSEFIWLHFSLSNSSTEPWLRHCFKLPQAFYESLHSGPGATRLEPDNNCLVVVMHDVLFDLTFDTSAVAKCNVYVDPQFLISARLRPLRSLDRLRSAVREGEIFSSSVNLLAHLLGDQANVLMEVLRRSTARVDDIEDKLLASRLAFSRGELGSLRRVLVRLQRLLAPEPASFFRLVNRPPRWIGPEDISDLRQAAEEFSAAVSDAQALIERVKLLQEELSAQITEQTNRTLYVLTLVTVLALPINMVAGLFGMNVGGIPLADNGGGFFVVIGILLVLTSLLAYLALIRKRDG